MSSVLIILDRDGVINMDSDDYIKTPVEWVPIESSLSAIAKLTKAGFIIAVASNQSGIGRGFFNLDTLKQINDKMLKAVEDAGGLISEIEFCADHPDKAGPFRKPAPGMLNKLLKQFDAKPEETWFVGDSVSDIQCAKAAGCKPALVLTGKGVKTQQSLNIDKNVPIYKNLLSFVDELLGDS